MTKKTIFLSHISEESELGTLFKDRLEKDFLSLIDVFVSSDSRSIPPGDAWLKAVDDNLNRAAALIVLASPTSVKRPWITFEAGAGWAKKVPTMVVCHSGIAPGGLPLPMGQLQAFHATDTARLQAMYGVIAGVLESATPEPNLDKFVAALQSFELRYTEERDILSALREIHGNDPQYTRFLRNKPTGEVIQIQNVPASSFRKVEPAFDMLMKRGVLNYTYTIVGMAFMAVGSGGGGDYGTIVVTIAPALAASLARREFE